MLPTTSTGLSLQGTPTTAPNTTISGTNNLGVSGSSALGGVSTLGGAAGTGAAGSAATSGQGANGGITGGTLPLGSNVSGINVGVPSASTGTSTSSAANPYINQSTNNQVQQLLQQENAALQQEVANTKPFQGNIDINALQAQAQSQAAGQVNPLYTNYLNTYLQGLAGQAGSSDVNTLNAAVNAYVPGSTTYNTGLNGVAEQQNTMNIQAEQAALANTLAVNTQAQNYAAQQNAANQGNINAQAANYQLNSGNAQNAKIQTLQQSMGQSGLALSGYGQGQLWQAENLRNAADAQQQGQFQYQRDTGNMSTQDTFAQLAQSSAYAQQGAGLQEAQTNFNLNDYLRQAALSDQTNQEAIATAQQNALTSATSQYMAQNVTNALAPYQSNAQQYGMGMQQYAGYLNPSSSMASAPDISGMLSQINVGQGSSV